MKYGIITHPNSLNYGDDIQSLAALKLMKNVDIFCDRENLDKVASKEPIKVLCNGWFMENPNNWPPALDIDPLFISFHITHNNSTQKILLSKDNIDYFKKHEPIGCRDYSTLALFRAAGVAAYYSGCVTLTLENESKPSEKTEEILLVDPFNKNMSKDLRQKMTNKLIPSSIKNNVISIEHSHLPSQKSMTEKLQFAEKLIQRYSKAHLVVTSRIHVALPCIALGTPVLFMDVGFNLKKSRNRFKGVIEYFNKMDNSSFPYTGIDPISLLFRRAHFYKYFYNDSQIKFDWENPAPNPVDVTKIAQKIRRQVDDFIL